LIFDGAFPRRGFPEPELATLMPLHPQKNWLIHKLRLKQQLRALIE
jgi:hypothetical protein